MPFTSQYLPDDATDRVHVSFKAQLTHNGGQSKKVPDLFSSRPYSSGYTQVKASTFLGHVRWR